MLIWIYAAQEGIELIKRPFYELLGFAQQQFVADFTPYRKFRVGSKEIYWFSYFWVSLYL